MTSKASKPPSRARAAAPEVGRGTGAARAASDPDGSTAAAPAALARYRAKRDFSRTPEPAGEAAVAAGFRYVIHKHWASRLHYDLRLELGGTMRSFAVPKGPSLDPRDKRLAVAVEDHPIEYNDFEGQIPAGQYGGGRVIVWDRGTWSPLPGHDANAGIAAGNFKFVLHGAKLQGAWALVRIKNATEAKPPWLLIKEKDAFARPAGEFNVTEALPDSVGPANPRARPEAILADTVQQIRARKAQAADSAAARTAGVYGPHPNPPPTGEGVKPAARPQTGADQTSRQGSKNPASSPSGGRQGWGPAARAAGVARPQTSPPPVQVRGRPARARGSGGNAALPDTMAPQLATLASDPPSDAADWLWELKFDGYRLLARIDAKGAVKLVTRNGLDWTARMPELVLAVAQLDLPASWLDGEIVIPGADDLPDFGALQRAFEGGKTAALRYYVFDAPFLRASDLREQPLTARRRALEGALAIARLPPAIRLSQTFDADPHSLLASACQMGMEGLIGKRASAAYRSGRSTDWIKLKCGQGGEFVIAGFTAGQGARAATGEIGALVLAAPTAEGDLRWAGNVGSGFDGRTLTLLKQRLAPLIAPTSPLAAGQRVKAPSAITWVQPELVAQIAHAGVTRDGHLRHPVFQGLREDKAVAELQADAARGPVQPPPPTPTARAAMKPEASPGSQGEATLAGQKITHPERVIDPSTGATKLDLARYYATVAPLLLPHLAQRPVALLRAPDGIGGEQFFQKHNEARALPGVTLLDPALDPGHAALLEIGSDAALLGVVQMNAVELHTWNSTHDRIDRPDRFVLDLDPGEGVAWVQVQEAALLVRTLLTELGLVPFLKTSGGKGLHVVTPIKRLHDWEAVKAFSKQLVEHLAALMPDRFTAVSGPKNRIGKIYPDYLRNGWGATTVCAWSARARPGLGVSVPVRWDELAGLTSAAQWTVGNIESRLRTGNAPWDGYGESARAIGPAIKTLAKARA